MSKKKTLRKLALESGEKFSRDVFFNKKRRKELKTILLKSQREILTNSDPSIRPVLKEEYAKRALDTSVLAFTVKGLETIQNAEERDKKVYLTNCKFVLHKKGLSFVFKGTFLKPLLDTKKKESYLYFPNSLPKVSRKKAYIYKDGKSFSLEGYEKIDSGTFRQKILDYKEFTIKYKGKDESYNFKLNLIDDSKQSYWAISI